MMIETSLASLAQNIDGCVWPCPGEDEKPSAYIDLPHAEVEARLRELGQPPTLLDDLAEILRGTLAFDESFGEMVAIAGQAEADADPFRRNLDKLGIPPDFPTRLCVFTPVVRDFCVREGLRTITDFLAFARGASRQLMIGGEFRELLNAVAHIDETTLARFLPFRPRATGLHLVEALAHLVRPLPLEKRVMLVRRPDSLPAAIAAEIPPRLAYFQTQLDQIRAEVAQGKPLPRLLVSLDDLSLESAVAALLTPHLVPANEPDVAVNVPRKRGLLHRLFASRI